MVKRVYASLIYESSGGEEDTEGKLQWKNSIIGKLTAMTRNAFMIRIKEGDLKGRAYTCYKFMTQMKSNCL